MNRFIGAGSRPEFNPQVGFRFRNSVLAEPAPTANGGHRYGAAVAHKHDELLFRCFFSYWSDREFQTGINGAGLVGAVDESCVAVGTFVEIALVGVENVADAAVDL